MTAETMYRTALSLLPTNVSEDDSLREYVVGWVNLSLAELFNTENAIRASKGEEELEAPAKIENIEEEVPCAFSLNTAIIYNLASLICKDDDDAYWAQDYRSRFVVAAGEATPLVQGVVKDYYGGDADA